MANTTIRLRESGVSGNVPSTLDPGELAINHADGKLYYGNTTSHAKLFDAITEPVGLDSEIQFNSSGSFGADADFRYLTSNNSLLVPTIILSGINVGSTLSSAYNQANTAQVKAEGAYNQANTATTNAATAQAKAEGAYNQANTATTNAATAQTHANAGYDKANSAYTLASSSYDHAISMAIALG